MSKNQLAQNVSCNKFVGMSDPQESDEKTEKLLEYIFQTFFTKIDIVPPLGKLCDKFFGEELNDEKLKSIVQIIHGPKIAIMLTYQCATSSVGD